MSIELIVNNGDPQRSLIFQLKALIPVTVEGVPAPLIVPVTIDLPRELVADGRHTIHVNGQPFEFTKLFGDIDGNGGVDTTDFIEFGNANGSTSGQPAYKAAFDFDGDGTIGQADYAAFEANYNKSV